MRHWHTYKLCEQIALRFVELVRSSGRFTKLSDIWLCWNKLAISKVVFKITGAVELPCANMRYPHIGWKIWTALRSQICGKACGKPFW